MISFVCLVTLGSLESALSVSHLSTYEDRKKHNYRDVERASMFCYFMRHTSYFCIELNNKCVYDDIF